MPPISSEDVPQSGGPNASMPFGDATQFRQANREIQTAGGPPQMPAMPQGPGGQQPPQGTPPPQQAQPPGAPVQPPPPRQPLTPHDLRPGGPVFSATKLEPARPWREQLRAWASHPDAGPFLATLRQRADAGLHQQQPPKGSGQQ